MNNVGSRRNFLKKVAYVAPMIFALGAMTAPMSAHASIIFTKGTWNAGSVDQFEAGQHYDNVKNSIENGYLSYDYGSDTYATTEKFTKLNFSTDPTLTSFFNGLFNNVPRV